MAERESLECGIRYYQALAKDFTPIAVCANFAALEGPRCQVDHQPHPFTEVEILVAKAA